MFELKPRSHTARITCLGGDEDVARIRYEIGRHLRELRYRSLDVALIEVSVSKATRMLIRDANRNNRARPLRVIYAVSDHGAWIRIDAEGSDRRFHPEATQSRLDREVKVLELLMDRVYFRPERGSAMLEYIRRK